MKKDSIHFDRNRRKRFAAPTGFTLAEVLVTIALIAIILPVVLRGASITAKFAATAKRQSEAVALAESKLNELKVTQAWKGGVMTGSFPDSPNYQWQAQVQTWNTNSTDIVENSAGNTTSELEVIVNWQGSTGVQSVTLSTLVYTPGATANVPAPAATN